MEPEGSMAHSQGLSNNPYPEPNQSNSLYFFNIRSTVILPRGLLGDMTYFVIEIIFASFTYVFYQILSNMILNNEF